MTEQPKIIQAPCNDCTRNTDHEILKSHSTFGHDEEDGVSWSLRFEMLECRGCHFISLKRTFDFSEHPELEVEYFPPPISRRKPVWFGQLVFRASHELSLDSLHGEVYSALHANNRRLATMGARTLLDMAIIDSVGDVGTFKEKLEALQQKGLVANNQREFLDAALETGNAAAHRGHCPTAQQLNQVMDIVESVLHQIYILPDAAADLKKSTPPRKKPTK